MLISRRSRDKILTLCLDRLPVSPGVFLITGRTSEKTCFFNDNMPNFTTEINRINQLLFIANKPLMSCFGI